MAAALDLSEEAFIIYIAYLGAKILIDQARKGQNTNVKKKTFLL